MIISVGEVWLAEFPFEENSSITKKRPVIVLNVETLEVLSVKVTKSPPRPDDIYDTPLVYGSYANLHFISTARVSKTIKLNKSQFDKKIGNLHPDDLVKVQEMFIKFIQENT